MELVERLKATQVSVQRMSMAETNVYGRNGCAEFRCHAVGEWLYYTTSGRVCQINIIITPHIVDSVRVAQHVFRDTLKTLVLQGIFKG